MLEAGALLTYAPLAAAFAVVASAIWAAAGMNGESGALELRLANLEHGVHGVSTQLDRAEEVTRRRAVETVAAREAASRASAAAERAAEAGATGSSQRMEPAAPRLSPLEQDKRDWLDWLETLQANLDRWAAAAQLPASYMDELHRPFQRVKAALAAVLDPEAMPAVKQRIAHLEEETMLTAISKTDRDTDPRRENTALRALENDLLRQLGLTSISPRQGDRLEPELHRRFGVAVTPPGARRGTIAAVRTRGLRNSAGEIVAPAEIIEFD